MLKQVLLASCVVGLATSVAAADITNPFYLPKQNEVGTATSVAFRKQKSKVNIHEYFGAPSGVPVFFNATNTAQQYNGSIQEELQYGLTDNLSLVANMGNTFNKWKEYGGNSFDVGGIVVPELEWASSDKTDYNPQWGVGLAWNVLTGPTRLQLMAKYGQDKLLNNGVGEYKYVNANVKFGYQFQKLLPYLSVGEELPIAQAHGYNKPEYNVKLGLYQGSCEKWGLDTGVRWVHSEAGEINMYLAEAEASYYLNPKTTFGVYGTYSFKDEIKDDYETGFKRTWKMSDKSIGMRLRKVF